ncbi:MAG: stage II sporulation protein R [Oscillospiraceae bacterium]|jgi:stage II sporulation protein R|nr:stage II sporulation protein R [Oscillospiraceae bacterium]
MSQIIKASVKKSSGKSKRAEITLILAFSLAVLSCSFTSWSNSLDSIRGRILRLHILANSDSGVDQQMKYEIRDRILAYGGKLFYSADLSADKQKAKNRLAESLEPIKQIAQEVIAQYGRNYPIEVTLERKYFNTRSYDEITLPAGKYDALVVRIGKAEGKNWWCVMFPPMCLPAAEERDSQLSRVLDDGELRIISDDANYKIKFAIVEAIESLKNRD